MRERMAYLIMIGMFIVLVIFVLAVIGKGEYQPPPEEREQGGIRSEALIQDYPAEDVPGGSYLLLSGTLSPCIGMGLRHRARVRCSI